MADRSRHASWHRPWHGRFFQHRGHSADSWSVLGRRWRSLLALTATDQSLHHHHHLHHHNRLGWRSRLTPHAIKHLVYTMAHSIRWPDVGRRKVQNPGQTMMDPHCQDAGYSRLINKYSIMRPTEQPCHLRVNRRVRQTELELKNQFRTPVHRPSLPAMQCLDE